MTVFTQNYSLSAGSPSTLPAGINRTEDFLGTWGVNTELYGSNLTPYVNASGFVTDVSYLGVRLVRWDISPGTSPNTQQLAVLRAIAVAGMRIIALPPYIYQGNQTQVVSDLVTQIKMLNNLGPGNAVFLIEGLNEPSNFQYTYGGVTGGGSNGNWTSIAQFQKDYFNACMADSVLKNIPITSPTNNYAMSPNVGTQYLTIPTGAGTTFAAGTAFGNALCIHVYPEYLNGGMCQVVLGSNDASQIYMSGDHVSTSSHGYAGYTLAQCLALPKYITEYNWRVGTGTALSNDIRGRNVLTGLFSLWVQGYAAICVHEVYDEGDGYGIYLGTGNATTLATYMHNLSTIMNDTAVDRAYFTPTATSVVVSDLPATGGYHVFQKSNGTYMVALWNAVQNWTGTAAISISPVAVKVTFPSAGTMNSYDPIIGTSVRTTASNAVSLTVSLTDHVLIVEQV